MGLSQKEMADILGVSVSAYNMYETGARALNQDIVKKLSEIHNVSTDIILDMEKLTEPFTKVITPEPEISQEGEIDIPVVGAMRCGFGRAGEPIYKEKKPVPISYVKRWGKDIVYYEAVGESMLPTIMPGDLLITVPGSAWEDGWIVIVDINDSDTIKRIYRADDGGIILTPDNFAHYRKMHLSPEELEEYNVAVLGHVVKAIGADL